MFAVFRISKGPDEGRSFSLMEGHELIIGRAPDVGGQLSDNNVAEKHCSAKMQQSDVTLTVLAKGKTTTLNGQPVTQPQLLKEGDVIQLGSTLVTFELSRLDEQATLMME